MRYALDVSLGIQMSATVLTLRDIHVVNGQDSVRRSIFAPTPRARHVFLHGVASVLSLDPRQTLFALTHGVGVEVNQIIERLQ